MSGLGTALSAAVQGFVDGKNVRNSWQDRQDTKRRQQRQDEIADEQEKRAQETHDQSLATNDLLNQARIQQIRSTDQAWSDDQNDRDAARRADAAAKAGMVPMGSTPDATPPAGATVTPGPTVSGMGSGIGVAAEPAVVPAMAPAAPAAPSPTAASAPQAAASPQPATVHRADPGDAGTTMGMGSPAFGQWPPMDDRAEAVASRRAEGALSSPDASFEDAARAARIAGTDGMPAGASPAQAATAQPPAAPAGAAPTDAAAPAPSTPFMRDMRSLGSGIRKTASLWGEQAVNTGSDILDEINRPFRAASSYFTGRDLIGPASRVDVNGDGKNTSAFSPYIDLARPAEETPEAAKAALDQEDGTKTKAPGKQQTPASRAAVANAATSAMEAVGESPSQQAAANATPIEDMGSTRGRPMSEPQRDKLALTYTESWRKNGAPIIMQDLLKQGRVEDAKKFDTFVRSQQAQEGMDNWMKGVVAAQAGDVDTAVSKLMDAYNSQGYFNDGYEVVKDKSSLIKDDTGNVVGLRLAMRNQSTGEVSTQTDSIEGFMGKAIWLTSPEKAFEASQERMKETQKQLLAAQAQQQKTKDALIVENFKAQQSAIDATVKRLSEAQQFAAPDQKMSEQELRQKATEIVMGSGGTAPGPGSPVPQVWRGE